MTGVETIMPQTEAVCGCMAAGSGVRVRRHGLWPRLNAGQAAAAMWIVAPFLLEVLATDDLIGHTVA